MSDGGIIPVSFWPYKTNNLWNPSHIKRSMENLTHSHLHSKTNCVAILMPARHQNPLISHQQHLDVYPKSDMSLINHLGGVLQNATHFLLGMDNTMYIAGRPPFTKFGACAWNHMPGTRLHYKWWHYRSVTWPHLGLKLALWVPFTSTDVCQISWVFTNGTHLKMVKPWRRKKIIYKKTDPIGSLHQQCSGIIRGPSVPGKWTLIPWCKG